MLRAQRSIYPKTNFDSNNSIIISFNYELGVNLKFMSSFLCNSLQCMPIIDYSRMKGFGHNYNFVKIGLLQSDDPSLPFKGLKNF